MESFDGLKTLLVAFAMSTITLLTNFGFDITDAQVAAINEWLLMAWPVAMVFMRLRTVGPSKLNVPGVSKDAPSPWFVGILAVALVLVLAGCASNYANMIGASYSAIDWVADNAKLECGNPTPGADCAPGSLIDRETVNEIRDSLQLAQHATNEANFLYNCVQAASGAGAPENCPASPSLAAVDTRIQAAQTAIAVAKRLMAQHGMEVE